MKIKHFLAASVALIGLTYFTPQEASASTINTSDTSANAIDTSEKFFSGIKIFDGNGEQIHYTTEELHQMFTFVPADSTVKKDLNLITPFAASSYSTGNFSFSNWIYVNGGYSFYNPTNVLVSLPNNSKAFTIHIFNSDFGLEVSTVDVPEGLSGAFHMSLGSSYKGYSYQFKFANYVKGQTVTIKNCTVYY